MLSRSRQGASLARRSLQHAVRQRALQVRRSVWRAAGYSASAFSLLLRQYAACVMIPQVPDAKCCLQVGNLQSLEELPSQVGGQRSLSFIRDVINRVKGEVERWAICRA